MISRIGPSAPLLALMVFPVLAQAQTHECREVMVKMRDGVVGRLGFVLDRRGVVVELGAGHTRPGQQGGEK